MACGTQCPNQGLNPSTQHWEHRLSATGPPRKSPLLKMAILTLMRQYPPLLMTVGCMVRKHESYNFNYSGSLVISFKFQNEFFYFCTNYHQDFERDLIESVDFFGQLTSFHYYRKNTVLVAQSCPTLCDHMDCSPPGFSVHGVLQAGILEWVAIPFSRGSSQHRD